MEEHYSNTNITKTEGRELSNIIRKKVNLFSDLYVEVDGISFNLVTDDNSAVITFNRFLDGIAFMKKIKTISSMDQARVEKLQRFISSMGITVYLFNRSFGLFGPKAGFFIPRLFNILTPLGRK